MLQKVEWATSVELNLRLQAIIPPFLSQFGGNRPCRLPPAPLTRIHRRTPMDGVRAAEGGG